MNLQQAFDEAFDIVKGYVDRSFDGFDARIRAIETHVGIEPPALHHHDAEGAEAKRALAALLKGLS